jgi:hypothetical protein
MTTNNSAKPIFSLWNNPTHNCTNQVTKRLNDTPIMNFPMLKIATHRDIKPFQFSRRRM